MSNGSATPAQTAGSRSPRTLGFGSLLASGKLSRPLGPEFSALLVRICPANSRPSSSGAVGFLSLGAFAGPIRASGACTSTATFAATFRNGLSRFASALVVGRTAELVELVGVHDGAYGRSRDSTAGAKTATFHLDDRHRTPTPSAWLVSLEVAGHAGKRCTRHRRRRRPSASVTECRGRKSLGSGRRLPSARRP